MEPSRGTVYLERARSLIYRGAMLVMPADAQRRLRGRIRRETFATIAAEGRWGDEHLSGWGSTVEYTERARGVVAKVIADYGIRTMVDVACGDFAWMPMVLDDLGPDFVYTGCDIVQALVAKHAQAYPQHTFRTLDLVTDDIPQADLLFCRDALQHLPVRDILAALDNFRRSGCRYVLTTTHLRRFGRKNGRDRRVGQCQDRNLMLPPFSLPDPIVIYAEGDSRHKFLALWEINPT